MIPETKSPGIHMSLLISGCQDFGARPLYANIGQIEGVRSTEQKRGIFMQTVYWLILFVILLIMRDLDYGTYDNLVCRRSAGGICERSDRLRSACAGLLHFS